MIRHLRESVALLPVEDLAPVDEFYRRLFELAPEVRPLFKTEMGPQAKKFSDMLAWVSHTWSIPRTCVRECANSARATMAMASRSTSTPLLVRL